MAEYSWTGDAAADQMLMQALLAQQGQGYYRAKNRLSEDLNARGFGGGGVGLGNLDALLAEQAQQEGNLQVGAAQAQVQRVNQKRQQEQEVQNQMRLMAYGAELQKPKKMTRAQRAALYGVSGATIGASVGGPYAPIAALAGGAIGAAGGALTY